MVQNDVEIAVHQSSHSQPESSPQPSGSSQQILPHSTELGVVRYGNSAGQSPSGTAPPGGVGARVLAVEELSEHGCSGGVGLNVSRSVSRSEGGVEGGGEYVDGGVEGGVADGGIDGGVADGGIDSSGVGADHPGMTQPTSVALPHVRFVVVIDHGPGRTDAGVVHQI